jgi:hypothetical protein
MLCGKPLALTADDLGRSRPLIDRTNGWMTSAAVNALNLYGYLLRDGQYYLIQKCNLVADAETKTSKKTPRAYKCVAAKYDGLDSLRLLWLDQPIATKSTDREEIKFVSDILLSPQLQRIDLDPTKAEEQVEALIAEIEQQMDSVKDQVDRMEPAQERDTQGLDDEGEDDKADRKQSVENRATRSSDEETEDDENQARSSQLTTHYTSHDEDEDDHEDNEDDEHNRTLNIEIEV